MKTREKTIRVTLSIPVSIWNYFEKCAREELEDECSDINKVIIAHRRSEMMINELRTFREKKDPEYSEEEWRDS